jgi:hypothetical protein
MIRTFAEACKKLKLDPVKSLPKVGHLPKAERAYYTAFAKLTIIVKALNDGWVPDWNDGLWNKWRPWFYLNNPGFRFGVSSCTRASSRAGGGSRLCLKSEALSDYCGKKFLSLWRDLMVLPAPAKKMAKKSAKKK